jgi:hypothetical protein
MGAEAIYEIARYREGADGELIERVQLLLLSDGSLRLQYADGQERLCAGDDACSVIAAEPDLNGVRADEVTRIQGRPDVLERLPLLLRGRDDDFPEGVDDSPWAYNAYVDDERWGALPTTDGLRMFPTGGYAMEFEPFFKTDWASISFIETASRTSGYFTGRLGLITPAVVADFYDPDEDDNALTIFPRGDDAQTVTDWLLYGGFSSDFYRADDFAGLAMLAQLFVEAALPVEPSGSGDRLAAGNAYEDTVGASPSAEWSMWISLDDDVIQGVLARLSDLNARLADIVTGALNPDSPPGRARAAALKELDDYNDS